MTPGFVPDPAVLLDRACGAMLGLAIGDALGATVEFMTPREIAAQYGVHDRIRGGGWLRLPAGEVTDDTTMTFALAEAWLAAGAEPDAAACARAFDGWMRAKPVDIGNTVRRGILRWRKYGSAEAPQSEDAGNGAAMRCLPVALALYGAPEEDIVAAADRQGRVTHHNPLTDAATRSVVRMVQAAMGGGGIGAVIAEAHALVAEQPAFVFRDRRCENPSGYIVDTLRAVFQAMDGNDGFEAVLVDIVNRGGDADTTGAIAGMVMGALCGETGLPRHLRQAVKAAVRGKCVRLATELLALSPGYRARLAEDAVLAD
ncbi:ADP-ribosyl-[dinitrogen reductase] hydrolase [Azoarcus indigens]|uniref:ADP-ribosyl-[dinitrogen reductase] hydrolase n=1 Tax=Azoarcus indigens TaxID=29545 RepID=A0A4R6DUE4_9RHOO|nr:ADP-ribosylglycohydrolase family protein [Azoarcus indigens]NMG67131.1 ADP-ribosyl-[dinitrogen reductase] hydrolase [Azoarcus indigens]TDN48723.1 ADP-ribosyl-[dinitrogen reductase] hydrolase [Azoarcus indigens]